MRHDSPHARNQALRGMRPVPYLTMGLFLALTLIAFPAEPPALFVKACAPCHGKDGKATTPAARKLGVKDLSLSQLTEAEIQRQMIDGRKGPDGSIKMPSFQETLKPADIELLSRYVKTLQQQPGKATSRPSK